ncbi:hypothetical protein [Winogradskyella luteola]|uniref:Holin-X, holin superfamily III n=1 Tax=Winogradskyella luteola TaxID=2828330 RepID=A0A9X1F5N1_9FLAO|nr:hypothetical protein [Winogradskyella luteola]MBV7267852.1 hypothetical protein [Winogradskyella luteola]
MSVFDDLNTTTDKASGIGERYIKTSHQYIKLKIFQQLTLSFSILSKVLVIGGFAFFGIIFLAVALAIKLGNVFNSIMLGYLAVGIIFMGIALIIYILRSKINKLIIKTFSSKFFD